MQKNYHKKNQFRIKEIISIILFILFVGVSLYQINFIFDAPLEYGRIVSYLILFFSLPLSLFLGIGVLRHFTNFIKKSWVFYTFQFLITIILSLVILSSIENKIKEKILAAVKNNMSSIIFYIEKYKEQNDALPKGIDNVLLNPNTLKNIRYHSSSKAFILEINVPSIDIDGYKIFYDSRNKKWYQFHNDKYQYYQNKKEKPESIRNYISLIKQTQ